MRVKEIRPAGVADVYNMEVDDTHDFAVQGGVIVHNCADMCRYICMARPITPQIPEPQKARPYDPLSTDDTTTDPYEFYRRY